MASIRITSGDINGFIGLAVDNISVLAFLAGALIEIGRASCRERV